MKKKGKQTDEILSKMLIASLMAKDLENTEEEEEVGPDYKILNHQSLLTGTKISTTLCVLWKDRTSA